METQQPVRLRVFSLNCWGIRYLSRHCEQRFEMIADMLERERHDIVLLQEVWSEQDFLSLKRKLSVTHPYSHHFKSGVIGSGLAFFSKYTLQNTLLHQYSLNGYPYKVRHGDWFGGKAVGLAVLDVTGLRVHVYITHLHAEYCRSHDEYLAHRTAQAWELQQFVHHTSRGAALVVLGGDLNMHPQDLGTRLVQALTGLRDCYTEAQVFDGCEDGITLIADNPFTKREDLIPFEKGIRIDYIMFKGSESLSVQCESLSTTKGSVPGHPFPYSDHEALTAELVLFHSEGSNMPVSEGLAILTEAQMVVREQRFQTESMLGKSAHLLAVGVALLLLTLALWAVPWICPGALVSLLSVLCLTAFLSGVLLYLLFLTQLKALRETDQQMSLSSNHMQERFTRCRAALSASDEAVISHSPSPFKWEE
ncbi:sphingomyelin phosphodiesterase 2a [Chanos chanos]|uniref:sphingomyelin phosphodiesterase n=1 Tax=Chanos chanos TaxID=29144 RepID=A0A6J2UT87_CHACN|nr:sphingomyelin phosphodiesterase 2-like [Chanos chanos]